MKSDLMDNHMEQPPDECEAAKSEKQMKQQVIYSPRLFHLKFNPIIIHTIFAFTYVIRSKHQLIVNDYWIRRKAESDCIFLLIKLLG